MDSYIDISGYMFYILHIQACRVVVCTLCFVYMCIYIYICICIVPFHYLCIDFISNDVWEEGPSQMWTELAKANCVSASSKNSGCVRRVLLQGVGWLHVNSERSEDHP